MKQTTGRFFAGAMALLLSLPCAALQSGVTLNPGAGTDTQTDTPTYVTEPEQGKEDGTFVISHIGAPKLKDKNLSILLKKHIFTEGKPFAVDAQIVNRGKNAVHVQLADVLVADVQVDDAPVGDARTNHTAFAAVQPGATIDKKKYTVQPGETLDLRLANFTGLPTGEYALDLQVWKGDDAPEWVSLTLLVGANVAQANEGVELLPLIKNEYPVAPITTPAATLTPAKESAQTAAAPLASVTPEEFMRGHRDPDFFLMNGLVYARVAYKEGMKEPLVQKGKNLGKINKAKVRKDFADWNSTKLPSGTRIYACKGKDNSWAVSADGKVYRLAETK